MTIFRVINFIEYDFKYTMCERLSLLSIILSIDRLLLLLLLLPDLLLYYYY